ncbi:unnamed protein product [Caenorhabditis sp. 36 PRJEB53466]|nr:unnamed protein product [Caenorhabditis sp. 36 PRJEB53466]
MIKILFRVICKITFALLAIAMLLSGCVKKKVKSTSSSPESAKKTGSPTPPGNPYPNAWRGRQKPMVVFDDKPSDVSRKSAKTSKSVEEPSGRKNSTSSRNAAANSIEEKKEREGEGEGEGSESSEH